MHGLVLEPPRAMLVMEYTQEGTLLSYMENAGDRLSLQRKMELLVDVAAGMQYLAAKHIVHSDLRWFVPFSLFLSFYLSLSDLCSLSCYSENVWVCGSQAKVTDFGYGRHADEESDKLSFRWMAPELNTELPPELRDYTTATDIFRSLSSFLSLSQSYFLFFVSFGVTVVEVFEDGRRPYSEKSWSHPEV